MYFASTKNKFRDHRVGWGRPEAFPFLRGYYFGYRALPVLWQMLATEKKKNHQRGVGRKESDRGGVALSGSPWRVK